MKQIIFSQVLIGFVFSGMAFAAGAAPAQSFPLPVCDSPEDTLSFQSPGAHVLRTGGVSLIAECSNFKTGKGTYVLLGGDPSNSQALRVIDRFSTDSPKALFVSRPFAPETVAFTWVDPAKGIYSDYAFYTDSTQPSSCATGTTQIYSIELRGQYSHGISFGEPQATGVCIPPASIRLEIPGSQKIQPLPALDKQVDRETKSVTFILLNTTLDYTALAVLKMSFPSQALSSVMTLTDPKAFVQGCGAYLLGARLLPKSTKVALFYKSPRVLIADYSTPAGSLSEAYNGSMPGQVSTCEGMVPSAEAIKGIVDVVQNERAVYFKNFSRTQGSWVLTKIAY